ncbi:MAG: hypothetical protein IJL47_06135, partial [Lachnospiraceae bacterium]|nr:hypothetical protein [Lachnospiraceae bacterium]
LEILNDPVYNTLHRGTPPDGLCDTVQSNLTTRGCSLFISPTKILHYARFVQINFSSRSLRRPKAWSVLSFPEAMEFSFCETSSAFVFVKKKCADLHVFPISAIFLSGKSCFRI